MRVELTTRPSTVTGGATSTRNPRRAPSSVRSATSPPRSRPNRKSSPTSTSRTSPAPASLRANSSGGIAANSRVKWKTATASAPASSSRSRRSETSESADGGAPVARTSMGSGSNVVATARPPSARARRAAARISARCPTCTPSKTPIATWSGPRGHPAKSWSTVTPEDYGAALIDARGRRLRERWLGDRRDHAFRRGPGRGCHDARTPSADDPPRLATEERHRRGDREDVSEVVALEVASEEEERQERERVAGQHGREGGIAPQPAHPPERHGRRDGELDDREREVRLTVLDDSEREQQRREPHAADRVAPRRAAGVVPDDVVVEGGEVVREERDEGHREEDRGGHEGREVRRGVARALRPAGGDEPHEHERQDQHGVELRRGRRGDGQRAEGAPLALEQRDPREEEGQDEEVVASLDHEREELRVQRDERGGGETVLGATDEERHHGERRDVRREVEVALVPEEPEVIEDPHERYRHQEQRREVREVVQGGVVHHRPVEERCVEVVGDVRVLPRDELARRPLDHQRAVVDVGV